MGLLFAETSAKTGEGVVEVFTEIGTSQLHVQCINYPPTDMLYVIIAKAIPIDQLLANSRANQGGRAGAASRAAAAGGDSARVDLTSGPNKQDGCAC